MNFFQEHLFFKSYGGLTFMGVRRWGKTSFSPPELGLENLKSASRFRLIDLILAITLYLPVWHSHCTKSSFTVLVWCIDELPVHSCPLLRLQTYNVAKHAGAWFCCFSLLRNTNMATNLQRLTSGYDKCVFPHVTVDLAHLCQVLFFEPFLLTTAWLALDLGAGVEQPFDCRIVQNRQAVQSMRRSMDWTFEDNMVDGLFFCATLTGRRDGHIPFV